MARASKFGTQGLSYGKLADAMEKRSEACSYSEKYILVQYLDTQTCQDPRRVFKWWKLSSVVHQYTKIANTAPTSVGDLLPPHLQYALDSCKPFLDIDMDAAEVKAALGFEPTHDEFAAALGHVANAYGHILRTVANRIDPTVKKRVTIEIFTRTQNSKKLSAHMISNVVANEEGDTFGFDSPKALVALANGLHATCIAQMLNTEPAKRPDSKIVVLVCWLTQAQGVVDLAPYIPDSKNLDCLAFKLRGPGCPVFDTQGRHEFCTALLPNVNISHDYQVELSEFTHHICSTTPLPMELVLDQHFYSEQIQTAVLATQAMHAYLDQHSGQECLGKTIDYLASYQSQMQQALDNEMDDFLRQSKTYLKTHCNTILSLPDGTPVGKTIVTYMNGECAISKGLCYDAACKETLDKLLSALINLLCNLPSVFHELKVQYTRPASNGSKEPERKGNHGWETPLTQFCNAFQMSCRQGTCHDQYLRFDFQETATPGLVKDWGLVPRPVFFTSPTGEWTVRIVLTAQGCDRCYWKTHSKANKTLVTFELPIDKPGDLQIRISCQISKRNTSVCGPKGSVLLTLPLTRSHQLNAVSRLVRSLPDLLHHYFTRFSLEDKKQYDIDCVSSCLLSCVQLPHTSRFALSMPNPSTAHVQCNYARLEKEWFDFVELTKRTDRVRLLLVTSISLELYENRNNPFPPSNITYAVFKSRSFWNNACTEAVADLHKLKVVASGNESLQSRVNLLLSKQSMPSVCTDENPVVMCVRSEPEKPGVHLLLDLFPIANIQQGEECYRLAQQIAPNLTYTDIVTRMYFWMLCTVNTVPFACMYLPSVALFDNLVSKATTDANARFAWDMIVHWKKPAAQGEIKPTHANKTITTDNSIEYVTASNLQPVHVQSTFNSSTDTCALHRLTVLRDVTLLTSTVNNLLSQILEWAMVKTKQSLCAQQPLVIHRFILHQPVEHIPVNQAAVDANATPVIVTIDPFCVWDMRMKAEERGSLLALKSVETIQGTVYRLFYPLFYKDSEDESTVHLLYQSHTIQFSEVEVHFNKQCKLLSQSLVTNEKHVATVAFLQVQQYTDASFVSMMRILVSNGILALNPASSLQNVVYEQSGIRLTSCFAQRQLHPVLPHLIDMQTSNGITTLQRTVNEEPSLESCCNTFHLNPFKSPLSGAKWLQQRLNEQMKAHISGRIYIEITHCAHICIIGLSELTHLQNETRTKGKAAKNQAASTKYTGIKAVKPNDNITQPLFYQPDNGDLQPRAHMVSGTTFSSSWNLLMTHPSPDLAHHITPTVCGKVLQLALFLQTTKKGCFCYTNSLFQILLALHMKHKDVGDDFDHLMFYLVYRDVTSTNRGLSSAVIKPRFVMGAYDRHTTDALFTTPL